MQQEVRAEVLCTAPNNAPLQMTSFNLITQNQSFQANCSWTIDEISKLMMRKKFIVRTDRGEVRVAHPDGLHDGFSTVDLMAKANGKVVLCLLMYEFDQSKPQVYYIIRDRSNAREPRHVCAPMHDICPGNGFRLVVNNSHVRKSCLTHPAYNVDDSIVVDFYVEPTAMAKYAHSYDGTLHWAIDEFRKRKQMEEEGLISGQESPHFYTDCPGYRVQLKFILNGIDENRGKGPSVEVSFLEGRWDKGLAKSYPHRLTLTLLNKSHHSANINKMVERNIPKRRYWFFKQQKTSYVVHLCSEREMENLVENDTLCYRANFEDKSK